MHLQVQHLLEQRVQRGAVRRQSPLLYGSGGKPMACVPQQAVCIIEISKRFDVTAVWHS